MELQGVFKVLGIVLITCFLGTIGFIILLFLHLFSAEKAIETKEQIRPEIRLEINNNKVDTVYVYKVK
jgi:hypothetical protein